MLKTIFAAALTAVFAVGAQAASVTINNGGAAGVTATIDDAGNFDVNAPVGLMFNGREYVNIDAHSAWYWFKADGVDMIADNSNPFGATTFDVGPGKAATTLAFGGWSFSQVITAIAPNRLTVSLTLTNLTGSDVREAFWSTGFDPDQDGSGNNTTDNRITGAGNASGVMATGPLSGYSVWLRNTTSAGAFDIGAYIASGDCCSPVDPTTVLAGGPAATFADDAIALGYDFGPIANGASVSIGYEYVFAVPEPETYALMLAGLAVVGWMSRRRRL